MGLMIVQLIGVIQNYFEYEITTRFEMKSHLKIPKITALSFPLGEKYVDFQEKFIEFYPEYRKSAYHMHIKKMRRILNIRN
jgi:hypothetical protein